MNAPTSHARAHLGDTLTDWYPVDAKPVHIGVYQTDLGDPAVMRIGFSYWDGNHWSHQYGLPETAERWGDNPGAQDKLWRGLRGKL